MITTEDLVLIRLLQLSLSLQNTTSIITTTVKPFPIGTLVWGKLPGYDWWPGCIISYDKKEIENFKEEIEVEEDDVSSLEEDGNGDVAWVKWYGDNQLSLVSQ